MSTPTHTTEPSARGRAELILALICLLTGPACGNAPAPGPGGPAAGTGGAAMNGGTAGAGVPSAGMSAGGGMSSGAGSGAAGAGGGTGGAGSGAAGAGSGTGGADGSAAAGTGGATGGSAGSGGSASGSGGTTSGGAGGGSGSGGASGGGTSGGGFPKSPTPVVLTEDGGYCWFEDPRALFHGDRLIVGSVASGWDSASRRGDIEAVVYDFTTNKASGFELHDRLELDDHDSPGFVARPDGRLVALYAKHGPENRFYYRVSTSDDLLSWGPERTFTPTQATRLTYSNVFLLSAENNRIYDFYRGLDDSYKPSYAYSDDLGETWKSGNIVINVPSTQRHRPYVRYASNGVDSVHLIYTEAHPRDFDNSLYHVFYRAGSLHRSDGTVIRPLTQGLAAPSDGTRIFSGNANNVAWGVDVVLDAEGRPVAAYSVQVNSAGLPTGQGGDDIRYRYARWDGAAWRDHALAYAGQRLYSGEDDYSGLVAIDPVDVNTVFISTNANPSTGMPLISAADNRRHYEIFRGQTSDGGQTWQWTPVTRDSRLDNLRPIAPKPGPAGRRALVWLRGTYRSYTDYQQAIVAVFWNESR